MECVHLPPVRVQWWARFCHNSSNVSVLIKFINCTRSSHFLTMTLLNKYTMISHTKIYSDLRIIANIESSTDFFLTLSRFTSGRSEFSTIIVCLRLGVLLGWVGFRVGV